MMGRQLDDAPGLFRWRLLRTSPSSRFRCGHPCFKTDGSRRPPSWPTAYDGRRNDTMSSQRRPSFQTALCDRLGGEGRVELRPPGMHSRALGGAGADSRTHPRISTWVCSVSSPGQSNGRRSLIEPSRNGRAASVMDGTVLFRRPGQNSLGIAEQYLAGRREVKPLASRMKIRNRQSSSTAVARVTLD